MIYCAGHSIISPLGEGSQSNFEAVRAGRSGLKLHSSRFADVEPLCASLFDEPRRFVPLCVRSVELAAEQSDVSLGSADTVFILSTTKGDNLDLLTPARAIALHFDNPNSPVVVSNACTSGVCAQITAQRLIEAGLYSTAVVVGCDIQSRFIVSGFQAFKALSSEPCKPFSPDRHGLNLGEAAATIIFSATSDGCRSAVGSPASVGAQSARTLIPLLRGGGTQCRRGRTDSTVGSSPASCQNVVWRLVCGSIHNDANHISAPSRTGDGAYLCLKDVMENLNPDDINLLGVHGTGTLYNDDMELAAILRAGLGSVPRCSLKPVFGHTMGAAGVLETIIAMMQAEMDASELPALQHYKAVNVIKMLSGFGGVNAAIRLQCS